MLYQPRRNLTLVGKNYLTPSLLDRNITTDYLIVWGGLAGLHAAQALLPTNKKIVLIEKSICGGGMSGRSGGFLTPDSELGYRQYEDTYGEDLAKKIWSFGSQGQETIVNNIRNLHLDVDLHQEDSLLLWWKEKGKKSVLSEHHDRIQAGLESNLLKDQSQLHHHNNGTMYTMGLQYENCFGINPLQYCQALKSYLVSQWVEIYEHTALHKIEKNHVLTSNFRIDFDHVIFALGKVTQDIDPIRSQYTFGIQNFVTVSEPLTQTQIKKIFPDWGDYMCRDTQMVFTYYRLVSDQRLLIGWWNPISSFLPFEVLYEHTIARVVKEMKVNFPVLQEVKFEQYRSGRIQATKDLMPILDHDKNRTHHRWIQWAVGLPRAAKSGERVVSQIQNWSNDDGGLQSVFSVDRDFLIWWNTNNDIVRSVIFGLCNAKAMGLI